MKMTRPGGLHVFLNTLSCIMWRMALFDELRKAIEESGMTRDAIAKTLKVDEARLWRFMHHETGLSVEAVEEVAEFLGYEVRMNRVSKPSSKRVKKKGK